MKTIILVLLLVACVSCAPWLDLFLGRQPTYNRQGPAHYEGRRHRQGKSGSERWKEICRTINVDNYAFPGRAPYPAAPVCPW